MGSLPAVCTMHKRTILKSTGSASSGPCPKGQKNDVCLTYLPYLHEDYAPAGM